METWKIVNSRFDITHLRAWEGLTTLGSGYLHIRGSLEEHLPNAPQDETYMRTPGNVTSEQFPESPAKWGTFVPGVFGLHPMLNREMVNLPWFIGLAPVVSGERLDMVNCSISAYRLELDFRTATLERALTWHTKTGVQVRVHYERFVSASRKHLCLQRMTVEVDAPTGISVETCLDANVLTSGFDHFESVNLAANGMGEQSCVVVTDQGDVVRTLARVTQGAWQVKTMKRRSDLYATFACQPGQPLVIEKRTAVTTSRDMQQSDPAALLDSTAALSWHELRAEHAAAWAERWESCDVVVEGDTRAQIVLRTSLYHLLRSHVPDDPRVSIDAKGYAGDAYFGRFFWDTEMYMLPFYLYTDPARARTLVDFRVQSLPGAIENARRYGYGGARYAWESDDRGTESCAA